MRTAVKILIVALLSGMAVAHPGRTQAGPTDTPLPTFSNGTAAVHVYTAVGVIKNNDIETVFICTNLDTSPVSIGVEVFTNTGAPTNAIASDNGAFLGVAVGATVTLGTSGTALLTENATITALPNLRNGSGRVVATTKNIACTAMLVDELHEIVDPLINPNIPPPTVVNLPLIRVP
jgi:hypothetical protein